jgi:(E)-4-hydroxy-3-methylbut-2-enyl-diphosphate synthase
MQWSPRKVHLKGFQKEVTFGRSGPAIVQSMLDTPADAVDASIAQIEQLTEAGCEVIRISVLSRSALKASEQIVTKLENRSYPHILVADIHFAPHLAFDSLDVFHKVRVNPGNFVEKNQGKSGILSDAEHQEIADKVREKFGSLVAKAASLDRVLRIGVNHGSLGDRMVQRWGDTPRGMVESAMEYLNLGMEHDFTDMVVSLKASNVLQMLEANMLFVRTAIERDCQFPLHLGITEAGSGEEARIKSAQGIGYLLQKGVGETVRVSLAEDPVQEVPVSRKIAELGYRIWQESQSIPAAADPGEESDPGKTADLSTNGQPATSRLTGFGEPLQVYRDMQVYSTSSQLKAGEHLTAEPVGQAGNPDLPRLFVTSQDPIAFAVTHAPDFIDGRPLDLLVEDQDSLQLAGWLMQAARIRSVDTEFIACPGCARTLFNLQTVTETIKQAFQGYPGLKIAVMGCIVNGPGEMADADYGYVGAGKERIDLYRGRDVVVKGLAPERALPALAELIQQDHPEWDLPV